MVFVVVLVVVVVVLLLAGNAQALGSMAPIAVSYGENGRAFCGLKADGSHTVDCYGSDAAAVYGAPSRIAFLGLTAGDGYVCGLGLLSRQPYCWGNNAYVQQALSQQLATGTPGTTSSTMSNNNNVSYVEISAGDNHLCALRSWDGSPAATMVDCWGYNVTGSFVHGSPVSSLTSGSFFSCALFVDNGTAFCWGDDTGSGVISGVPMGVSFSSISAGGYHVCGIVKNSGGRIFCWGKSILTAALPATATFVVLVGGKFHECGLQSTSRTVLCWGMSIPNASPPPKDSRFLSLAAGDYFTCGVGEADRQPVCWGSNYPSSPTPSTSVTTVPGLCSPQPCKEGTYRFNRSAAASGLSATTSQSAAMALCQDPVQDICLKCSQGCPPGMMVTSPCSLDADRVCGFNCSNCEGNQTCLSTCKVALGGSGKHGIRLQAPIIAAELILGIILVMVVIGVVIWMKNREQRKQISQENGKDGNGAAAGALNGSSSGMVKKSRTTSKKSSFRSSLRRQAEVWAQEELKMAKAHRFQYAELQQATNGFAAEQEIGRGSFSVVYKGTLSDGRVVAVKKSILNSAANQFNFKESKDFQNELDLLSRLNHAHLLNLLGYCDENEERLLVYEYMANGTLHEHLHGKPRNRSRISLQQRNGSTSSSSNELEFTRPPLSWVRRVKIAVQAARGLEYLHGYACPPVIHRDIKSSNILLDEEWNARVADFGLSLLGPADSGQPLSELPAGTLGYLDPEYYRLHYLTPKSDVYSFGVLLLEMLSGRRAIDMRYEEGNIVEWAVPLIRAGNISAVLDPRLEGAPPQNPDALRKVARVAARCVRMRGRERPAMGKVTTSLERALALLLMGDGSGSRLILPTEVVLGSTRMNSRGGSMRSGSSNGGGSAAAPAATHRRRESSSETTVTTTGVCCSQVDEYLEVYDEERLPLDNPVLASLRFPSVSAASSSTSKRRGEDVFRPGSSMSDTDPNSVCEADRKRLEIGPPSPVVSNNSRQQL